jgi:hypothetical protein
MKLHNFLERMPANFVVECLEALPGVDRRRLLQSYKCRVKMGPATLKRQARLKAEGKKLHKVLLESDDVEDKRSIFQGWLARRAAMIIALLDAWEIEHQGGFVEDFEWVEKLDIEKVKRSLVTIKEEHEDATDKAIAVYFAYLEMPALEELFKLDEIFAAAV